MSDSVVLGTRKGTLFLDRKDGRWTARPIVHAGLSISYAARDPRDGTIWAAMDHAHWARSCRAPETAARPGKT